MESEIQKLKDTIADYETVLQSLVADRAALTAVVRALAESNASNPEFQRHLKLQVDIRAGRQLNSQMTDEQIDLFKASLNALLPQQLRDI
ncbi:hypothetical protein EHZ19_26850 [Paraburkholderia bannensis]|nr:hypothetical protein [Paraburkholderia bannensis]RQM44727.1 hypothetical protein EHZ19_26850 [Paraburkholderia bannensis]